jgi:hypothetical protein
VVNDEGGDGVGVEEGGCPVRSEDGGKVEVAVTVGEIEEGNAGWMRTLRIILNCEGR